jgi:hypothetical protein
MAEKKKYLVHTGLDYSDKKRAEPGDVLSDLPAKSIPWLLEQGVITLKESEES